MKLITKTVFAKCRKVFAKRPANRLEIPFRLIRDRIFNE
jgi:hypothetical protein